jgi:hypothetical protein
MTKAWSAIFIASADRGSPNFGHHKALWSAESLQVAGVCKVWLGFLKGVFGLTAGWGQNQGAPCDLEWPCKDGLALQSDAFLDEETCG